MIIFLSKEHSIESQCNKQGFTLGNKQDYFQQLSDKVLDLQSVGLLSDKETESVVKKLTARISKSCRIFNSK